MVAEPDVDVDVIPEEVLLIIIERLSPTATLAASTVCRSWRDTARDEGRWEVWYRALVDHRKYVPPFVRSEPLYLKKYFLAVSDATRTSLTEEEIASFEWCMRFHSRMGPSFMQLDPWWNNEPPLLMKLTPNREVIPLAPSVSQFWGHAHQVAGSWEYRINPDFGCAEVRVNGFPSFLVSRHPVHAGVYMQTGRVVWTAFPMPPRGIREGSRVVVERVVAKPELNGRFGTVTSCDLARGRCGVELDGADGEGNERFSLKQSALRQILDGLEEPHPDVLLEDAALDEEARAKDRLDYVQRQQLRYAHLGNRGGFEDYF